MNVLSRKLPARDRAAKAGSSRAPLDAVPAGLRRRVHHIMRRGADQVAAALVTAVLALAMAPTVTCAAPAAPAAPAPASSLNAFEQQLSKECAALTAVAVKTPFGWGWADAKPAAAAPPAPAEPSKPGARSLAPPRRVVKPVQVAKREEIDVRQTAAAGLVLYMAGEQLGDASLVKAATEAARALTSVQQASGQMPAIGILGANAGGRDEPSLVSSRGATCAALALLSTVIQGSEQPDPRLLQSAKTAATWLANQQTPAGAWPIAHKPAGAKEPTRLIRLDTPEYRDATSALLLAAHVLGDKSAGKRADDAVAALLAMRVRTGDERVGSLWVPGYRLTGEPLPKSGDLPFAIDTVSAQYSMQTLLAACLLGTDATNAAGGITPAAKAAAPALSAAAKTLDALPRRAVGWHRYYDVIAATPVPDLEPQAGLDGNGDLFASEDDAASAATADTAVLSEVLAAAKEIGATGLEKYLAGAESENAMFWPQHRVAIMLCGLGHGALATQFPQTKAEAATYVKANEGLWTFLEGPVPGDLGTRLERLQLLLVRSKMGHLK